MTMAREPVPDDGLTYEELKALAKAEGRPLESMYALSGSNDPFMVDMPRRQEAAEWFARFWRDFASEVAIVSNSARAQMPGPFLSRSQATDERTIS